MDLDLDGLRHWDGNKAINTWEFPHSRCQWTRGNVRGEVSEVTRIHPLGCSKQLVDVTRT